MFIYLHKTTQQVLFYNPVALSPAIDCNLTFILF